MNLETILVPLDGTRAALAALPVATTLRDLFKATLHVVHVHADAAPLPELLHEVGLSPQQLRGAVLTPLVGDPAAEILRLARSHPQSLVVMRPCTREQPRCRIGGVARAVLEESPCPVLLVQGTPGPSSWSISRILLPYDASPILAPAISLAAALAQRSGAELLVLYVEAAARTTAGPGGFSAPRYVDAPQHEWSAWAQEFSEWLYILGHAEGAMEIRPLLGPGPPQEVIPSYCTRLSPSLIVLGWEGRLHLGYGPILEALLREGPAPVLAVRGMV